MSFQPIYSSYIVGKEVFFGSISWNCQYKYTTCRRKCGN